MKNVCSLLARHSLKKALTINYFKILNFTLPKPKLGDVTAITITTPDLEKSVQFYKLLGFTELLRADFPFPWVQISDGALLAGNFPARQLKMVQVWVDLHKEELLLDWQLAASGEAPFRIEPLR